MMKFFQDDNPSRVWDAAENRVTVVFQDKVFETEHPAQIKLLVRAGYRHNGDLPDFSDEQKSKIAIKSPKLKRMTRNKK